MTAVPTCPLCQKPSHRGPVHPCCEAAQAAGKDECDACVWSAALEAQHQRRAAWCQCPEHGGRPGVAA